MNSSTSNVALRLTCRSDSPVRGVPGIALLILGALFGCLASLSCGGEEPRNDQASSSSEADPAAQAEGEREGQSNAETRASSSQADDSGDALETGEPLVITRATPLLSKVRWYNKDHLSAGRLPTGEGIWFTFANPRESRKVDRHIKGFELISQSYGQKFRDSRRSVVLIASEGQNWKSPLVRVPEKGSLSFSYMPYVVGMGGYTMSLDFRVLFEVEAGRAFDERRDLEEPSRTATADGGNLA